MYRILCIIFIMLDILNKSQSLQICENNHKKLFSFNEQCPPELDGMNFQKRFLNFRFNDNHHKRLKHLKKSPNIISALLIYGR